MTTGKGRVLARSVAWLPDFDEAGRERRQAGEGRERGKNGVANSNDKYGEGLKDKAWADRCCPLAEAGEEQTMHLRWIKNCGSKWPASGTRQPTVVPPTTRRSYRTAEHQITREAKD